MNLTFKILGEFQVCRCNKKLPLPKSKRTRALLAYLAMTSRPHRRDRLCETFWDLTHDPKSALRWSLSKIRSVINKPDVEILEANREQVSLQYQDIEIDVHQISEKIKDPNLSVSELENMLKQLEEPLLNGIDLPDQKLFQKWLIAERNEICRMTGNVLFKLSNHPELTPRKQLKWSRVWLEQEPYNTDAAKAVANQLKRLGETSELNDLLKILAQRYKETDHSWPLTHNHEEQNGESTTKDQLTGRDMLTRQKIKFCTTRDGVRVAYATVGEGYPIVKTANWLTHLEYDWDAPIWSPLFRDLATDHQFLRYDERGNGLSDWKVKELSFKNFVEDLETVVATCELDKFALLGISQGASVSIEYANRHPEKVSHLILFGGYAEGWRINASEEQIKEREAVMTLTSAGWGQDNPAYRQIFSSAFLPSANKEELDWFNEFQRLTTSPENAVRFLSVFGNINVYDQLSKVSVPTLVIHSLGDQRIPVNIGRDLASSIPNAEFVGLESDGHLLLGREPASKIFVETVREFIARA